MSVIAGQKYDSQTLMVDRLVSLSLEIHELRSSVVLAKLALEETQAIVELQINTDKEWLINNAPLMGLDESSAVMLTNAEARKNALTLARQRHPILAPYETNYRNQATRLERLQAEHSSLNLVYDLMNRVGVILPTPDLQSFLDEQLSIDGEF